jgi:uncharacterized membrane protein
MKRFLFLDLLRAIALIEMIHGHTLDALLGLFQKNSSFWIFWQNIRGFTAPLFLFASGLSFSISTLNKKYYLYFSEKLFTRLRRLIFIIFLGYILHLPYFSFKRTFFNSSFKDFENFLNVDILQCIGMTLLILQIFYFLLRNEKIFIFFTSLLFLTFYFLTIFFKKVDLSLPILISKYFKNSLFPLTPFSLYLFSGCIIGYFFLLNKKNKNFLIFSLIFFVIFLIFKFFKLPQEITFLRISIISFISFLTLFLENSKNKILSILQTFGKESLVVYFFHLPVVYGWVLNPGLRHFLSGKLNFLQIYIIYIFLLIFFFSFAIFWNKLKEKNEELSSKIKYLLYISFITSFFANPY